MNISGKTALIVNGKLTRVCGRIFNAAIRKDAVTMQVKLPSGEVVTPSKGLTWGDVAKQIRLGKQVQAATGTARKRTTKIAA